MFVHLHLYKHSQFKKIKYTDTTEIKVRPAIIFLIAGIASILLVNYYNETVKLAIQAGYNKKNGSALMLAYARIAVLNRNGQYDRLSRLAGYSATLTRATAYVFSYIYLYNRIIIKKNNIRYLLPVFIYIPFIILSTGRAQFIYLICLWIITGSCFYMQEKQWNPHYTFKIVRIGVISILLFLLLFIITGTLKSSTITDNIWGVISIYAGQSIPPNEYFGQNTLFGIYGILNKLNPSLPRFYAPYDFTSFNGTSGNVYTIIRRYHQDYGYFGLFFMMFFLGAFYSSFFLSVNNSRKKTGLIVYALLFSAIVEMSIEEHFFMTIVSLPTVQMVFFFVIAFKLIVKRSKSNTAKEITDDIHSNGNIQR